MNYIECVASDDQVLPSSYGCSDSNLVVAFSCMYVAVDCGSLDSPANGSVSLSGTTFQNLAEYSCDLGYLLVGSESRQCQANRTWSGENPFCEGKLQCKLT